MQDQYSLSIKKRIGTGEFDLRYLSTSHCWRSEYLAILLIHIPAKFRTIPIEGSSHLRHLAWCFLFGDTCTSKFGDLLLKNCFCKEVVLTDRNDEVLECCCYDEGRPNCLCDLDKKDLWMLTQQEIATEVQSESK
uniref:Uncharacterized protein n=1 Tax=Zea mays TaxID=4577 RepID=A0A804QVN9_MAIZE